MNYFEELNKINVNDKVEKKNGLTYLSWAWAWGELKKKYPLSYYTVYENIDGWNYFTDGKTAWVKTGVTVVNEEEKIEHIEYLPVMDFRNKSIPVGQVTSFDVNKTIQRSLTKAVARHGLGLYIYAGEDLPESEDKEKERIEEREFNQKLEEQGQEEVTSAQKKALVQKCESLGLNWEDLLVTVGWNKGEKLTKKQYGEAMNILIETEKKQAKVKK